MPRTIRKGLGRFALAQLRCDLKLTPEARVLEAEQTYRDFLLIRAENPGVPGYPAPLPTERPARNPAQVRERPIPVAPDAFRTRVALVCSVLNTEAARYCVVGAQAAQLWGTTRSTTDVDILIEPTASNADRVLRGLSRIGFGVAGDYTAEYVISRTVTIIGDTPQVDILTRAWTLEWREAAPRLVVFSVEGVNVPAASLEDLIASKGSGRLKDLADLEVLEAIRTSRSPRAL
jgi:hypothetical protein